MRLNIKIIYLLKNPVDFCFVSLNSASFQMKLIVYVLQIYVPTNPRGAELLPPGIVVAKTDLYLRRLWGEPNEVYPAFFSFFCFFCKHY